MTADEIRRAKARGLFDVGRTEIAIGGGERIQPYKSWDDILAEDEARKKKDRPS